jgi:hypothetical protein
MITIFPRKAFALFILIGLTFSLVPRSTEACGPFFTDALFVYSRHPDFPLEKFAGGMIGVVEPSWARSYLVVAYRSLSGNGLSGNEVAGMKSLWEERLSLSGGVAVDEGVNKWKEVRGKVPGIAAAAEVNAFRNREKPNEYESYLNCQSDAFETAISTLNDRIAKFGADSSQVRDWIAAQDTVFSNCSAGRQIPEAAAANQDALSRADRTYQIAAANFYSGGFDEAKQQFDAIAKDSSSPWRDKAPYLAARAMLRKGSFAEKEADRVPPLTDAESRLNVILKDKSLSSTHAAATRLLNLVRLRLRPEGKLHELAHLIAKKDSAPEFKQTVWDYTVLLDGFVTDNNDVSKVQIAPEVREDELTDWILTFEDDPTRAATHAFDQWQKTHSLPWLVAALTTAKGQQPNMASLLTAAAQVDHQSSAFPSAAFQRVRLLIEMKRGDEARTELDKILANDRAHLPASSLNRLLSQRTALARNLEEFLQSAQRKPAGWSDDNDGREIPDDESSTNEFTKGASLFFDVDAANAFNKAMPINTLKDAARSKTLPPNLRRDVAQAAFMRAALLDDREAAIQVAPILQESYPELKEFLGAYQRATTPEARKFATGFMALKFPGLRPYVSAGIGRTTELKEIDSYRDNYWCTEPPASDRGAPSDDAEDKPKPKPIPPPEFLLASRSLATKQIADLEALGTGPNFLCQMAIAWTEKNPADPRSPEALHLAVRSTRYGCTDKETGRWSKTAFDLLHQRYPNTVWAKNTKYWFKG